MNKSTLDTNILTAFLKNNSKVVDRITKYLEIYDKLVINVITYYEILRGLKDIGNQEKIKKFQDFIDECEIISISKETIDKASEIYANLKKVGALIGDADILIASIAIVEGLVLITDNVEHFKRINELQIENWLE